MPSRSKTTAATQLMTRLGGDSAPTKLKRELDRIAAESRSLLQVTTQLDSLLRTVTPEHPHNAEVTRLANVYLRDVQSHATELNALDVKRSRVQALNNADDWHLESIALSEDYMSWTASLQNVVLPIAEQITQLINTGVSE